MRRLLGSLAIALAVAVIIGPGATAASAPLVISDVEGDAIDGGGTQDIVSVTYETKVLKKNAPPSIVIVMKLAEPPSGQAVSYHTDSDIPGCGFFRTSYSPGTIFSTALGSGESSFFIECGAESTTGSAELIYVANKVKDNTITWSIALDSIPKAAREGKKLTALRGYTTYSEPIFGIYGNGETDTGGQVEGMPTDDLRSDKEFSFL